jgi:ribonuclease BN (tRNA processing enzyme)
MRLTIVGCTGSFAGPDSPASSYLVQAVDAAGRLWSVVIDLGSGAFGALQRHIAPEALDAVCLTHLHPDHAADMSGLHVYMRYHPGGPLPPIAVHGPRHTELGLEWERGRRDDRRVDREFHVEPWVEKEPVRVGPLLITPFVVEHPVEAYGLRIVGPSAVHAGAATLAFTGDSDECDNLDALAARADLLLAEASFEERRDTARGVHLTGLRAGQLARRAGAGRLVLTHLPPWTNPDVVLAEASGVFDGPIQVAASGQRHDL